MMNRSRLPVTLPLLVCLTGLGCGLVQESGTRRAETQQPLSRGQGTQPVELDETPAGPRDWGYRPAAGAETSVTPPSFSWRPQKGVVSWEIQVSRGGDWSEPVHSAKEIQYNVHCPPRVLPAGEYAWRYRGWLRDGRTTRWSRARVFHVPKHAKTLPMPARDELLSRIPDGHPRLFVRPEDLPRLRSLAKGALRPRFDALVRQCDRLLAKPPPTKEPPKYSAGMKRGSDPWRKVWWGNRRYTINSLGAAATLAFTRQLGGKEEYGHLAKRILLACARWDPHGSTGYRYNDEAGMPYNYYFARAYTYVHDLLDEEEREVCRRVMKARGDEMYQHLRRNHLWRPYGSHRNRAWHFLGEVGIAFHGEIPGADEWVWFAANVFFNVYPVWSDTDGGWHEGANYWRSYIKRFTWWADVMRSALDVNAYDKPYFSSAGYYAMYLTPPGKDGGGFGDLNARYNADRNRDLMTTLAVQSGNGHWAWYVNALGGPRHADGYIGFVRGALPAVRPEPPDGLPTSRVFQGTGQAFLNTGLRDARRSVQVAFKSSPFGTQSHGYESNNAFLLWAYGRRLLVRSGRRDSYGSEHHRKWMWSTRSVNCITVDGHGQAGHSASARGEITAFRTTDEIDIVVGEAAGAYGGRLKRFSRVIVFFKPELIVVYDRLEAKQPASFEYWLHGLEKFAVHGQRGIVAKSGDVRCAIDFLAPKGLTFRQTDQYDPNPRSRVKLREWHLTASTPEKRSKLEFVTLYRPYRDGEPPPREATLERLEGGYALRVKLRDGDAVVLLPVIPGVRLSAHGLSGKGIVARYRDAGGAIKRTVIVPAD